MALAPPGATRARPAGVRDDLGHVSPAWRAADGPGSPVCARMSAADLTRPTATPRTGVWPAYTGPGDRSGRFPGPGTEPLRILLVEDDAGDAFLVGELLAEAGSPGDLRVVATLAEALPPAWRALTLAGVPDATLLTALERVLITERRAEEIFATLATLDVRLDGAVRATVRLCGHPPPLVMVGDSVRTVGGEPQLMLGVLPGTQYPPAEFTLPERDWAVLLYTDGLIDGRVDDPDEQDSRLGVDGLVELVRGYRRGGAPLAELADWLVGQAEARNGGALADDVAMLVLTDAGAQTVEEVAVHGQAI